MKSILRFILIFNEAAALLTLMILIISDVVRNGIRIMSPDKAILYAILLLFCSLLPLSLEKPGLPFSKILAVAGAFIVSITGIPGLIGLISTAVTSLTGSSFEDFKLLVAFLIVFSIFTCLSFGFLLRLLGNG